ncbi:MAG: 6-phosphogluconolactonase [Dehalococcoidia bacterium]|nr:6-phosphogluconolactonase [Dehalococcoidia bacterium]
MSRELVVAEDLGAVASRLFLEIAPRTVALAGGRTPAALYRHLAAVPYPWGQTDLFFGDERCVPPSHADSNYCMAAETLLAHVPARVHPMPGGTCDATAYETELRAFFATEPPGMDLVLLGLGADGHTASLFPGDAALEEGERLVVRVARPDHARLTLTLPVLNAASVALFLVSGAEKAQALAALLGGEDIPAARVAAARVVVVADRAAVGQSADGDHLG